MKPSHFLKDEVLIVKLPKNYAFQLCWEYFTIELPKTNEFSQAIFCVVDGSKLETVDSLGMGSEIFLMGQKFQENGGQEFVLSGFQKEQISVLKLLSIEDNTFPKHFASLELATKFLRNIVV
ncbi:MAG: hypothetical protein JJ892_15185 [Balneola sp.]|nr:hypothetical protein [Balneola sp.]MBO6652323.1 hypothetical protein [Balneola sp.]MBO6712921.1 hypothetical protein [Balneola sp.]MBO6801615.1 hypothetical protein [Balneola sp.]MBO6871934.1 hypothetical protein [Balneola sp.]